MGLPLSSADEIIVFDIFIHSFLIAHIHVNVHLNEFGGGEMLENFKIYYTTLYNNDMQERKKQIVLCCQSDKRMSKRKFYRHLIPSLFFFVLRWNNVQQSWMSGGKIAVAIKKTQKCFFVVLLRKLLKISYMSMKSLSN